MRISVTVPEDVGRRVKEAAWADRVSASEWVRAAVEGRLGPSESARAVTELPSQSPPAGVVRMPVPTPSRAVGKPPVAAPVRNNTVAELFAEKKK